MTSFNPDAGFGGDPTVSRWAQGQAAIADMRRAADGASLMLWPEAGQLGCFVDPPSGSPAIYERLVDYPSAIVTRASAAWSDGWDRVNGSRPGPLIAHASNEPQLSPQGGLVMARSVENRIRNPRGEGAAAPALPTYWMADGTTGVTVELAGRGVSNGWPSVDISIDGEAAEAGALHFEGYSTVSAAEAETWTITVGAQLIAGSISQAMNLRVAQLPGGALAANQSATLDAYPRRWFAGGALSSGASHVFAYLNWPPGTVFDDAVIRITAPQLTQTLRPAMTVLPPAEAPGAATRASDSFQIPCDDWYRHGEGTMIVEFLRAAQRTGHGLWAFPDNSFWGRGLRYTDSGALVFEAGTYPSAGAESDSIAIAAGRHIAALRWSGRNHRGAVDGALSSAFVSSSDISPPTVLAVGAGGGVFGASLPSETPILRLRYVPRALSDAELAAVTDPYWS